MGKEQELVQSIRANDVESFKKVIAKFKSKSKKGQKKSSLHIVDHDGFIPLHHAALSGNGEIVMALLEFTTDVNAKDKKGMTPLHLAAWAGKVEPALLLLDAGAETNLCSRNGATPLHLASEHGNYGVVERLVDHNCDPTVVNNQGETALDLACRFGHMEVVRILLNNSRGKCEKLLNPKEFQEKASPLQMAAKTGHFDVVKLLVEAGADINQRGPKGTCLHEAALYGKTDVVKYLVEAGIDVNLKNREGQTALDIVTQFTKSGASSEIKHLLREASVEVVYAKAIKDYANITDDSFLALRLGDIVLVLDRRKDGLWKGCVRDDQKERIGFFPSSVVKVLRSPSRNSVKRSSSSSSEASKVSTVGTVSNTVEIVTVTPPNQPVAGKSRAPRMSSFRKKANKSQSESDDCSHRAQGNGEARRSVSESARPRSENEVDDKKKKLNYLDIVVVDNHNKKTGPPSNAGRTEYADVFVQSPTDSTDSGRTALDNANHKKTNGDSKDVGRTNETQKSVRVNGSYARLGQQMLGKQAPEDQDRLQKELQRQQEERLKRQQKRMEDDNQKSQDQLETHPQIEHIQRQQQQQQQQLQHRKTQQLQQKEMEQQKYQQLQKQHQQEQEQWQHRQQQEQWQHKQQQEQSPYNPLPQEPNRSSSETHLPQQSHGHPPLKSRHNTLSSLVTSSQDLQPVPLKKRHSLSGGRPSVPAVSDPALPPKLDKKYRSSLRADRRTTSPPPPPPPPPSGSVTPSPVASEVSSPRSPSPTLPPLPKPMDLSPISPTLINQVSSPTFFKQPVPVPSQSSPPRSQAELSPSSPTGQPVRSPSPSFPPPPPSISDPTDDITLPPAVVVSNQLGVVTLHIERSPSPPFPPPPESLASPSASSLGDLPPPPPPLTSMDEFPNSDHAFPSPPEMEVSDTSHNQPYPTSTQEISTTHQSETTTHAALHPPASSNSNGDYEDMSRLKRTWTKPEPAADKKGYVMVNPVKRPTSPESSPVNAPRLTQPISISSKLYENLIPLKTRGFEVRRLPQSVPEDRPTNEDDSSSSKLAVPGKPEKPCRHCYENCEVKGQHNGMKGQNSGECNDAQQESTSGALPVLRVPPVPQVPVEPPPGAANLRMREYDELYDWLAQSKLLAYMDNFAAAGFDLSAMVGLTPEDLTEILVTKAGHRKRLLSEASKLSAPALTYENNVPSWLKSLGLSRYENHFIEGGFDDMEFLYDLTKEDLVAIGITKVGHQRKLLTAAKKLLQRDNENQATGSNILPEFHTSSDPQGNQFPRDDVTRGGVMRVYADERVGDYAVPRVSHFAATETRIDEASVCRGFSSSEEQISKAQDFDKSSQNLGVEGEILESKEELTEEEFDNTVEMNGNVVVEDSTDGVRDLAASFQHAIHEETAKARGTPPPVKPKSYKKAPPPVVAPKPKANGVKINVTHIPHTDRNSGIDFTEVIKEAEALSESGSEQSPPSTLGRDRKSESGVSVGSSLGGSQGSLNSETDELQREIKESLHRKPSTGSSIEDITKLKYLTLSQEDLLEQQKREEELEKYQKEQSKTDSLFNDIQGMLDNLNSELDDMFK